MKNKKGITLIALVITIIVLLILAGISIAMLTGDNGLLNKATEAKKVNIEAEVRDRVNLAVQAVKIWAEKNAVEDSSFKASDHIGDVVTELNDDANLGAMTGLTATGDESPITITYTSDEYTNAGGTEPMTFSLTVTNNTFSLTEN